MSDELTQGLPSDGERKVDTNPMLERILDELRGLRDDVAGLRSEVAGLRAEVGELRREVAELRAEVDDVKHRLSSLERAMLQGQRDAIDRHLAVEKRVTALEEAHP